MILYCLLSFLFGAVCTFFLVRRDFVNIARDVVNSEQADLRKQNQEILELKLEPLSNEIKEFRAKVESFNLANEKNSVSLMEKIALLEKSNAQITKEANALASALTTNQNVKGAYGEALLETILASCGMVEGVHYQTQYSTISVAEDETMHRVRPDVVLFLPENRHLIIDSKLTLTSYLDYLNDEQKDLGKFRQEIKKRITELSNKNYQNIEELNQPDFVLMYVPIENCLAEIYNDSELVNYAYSSNIMIVGTASLLTTLRLVNRLTAQQKQEQNVARIVKAGTSLYENFMKFSEELLELKSRLGLIHSDFSTLINRFQRGNKTNPSLFSQVEELKQMGITTTKEIPEALLQEVE